MVIGMQCINSSVRSVDLCGLTRPILSWRDTSRLLLNVSGLPGMTGRKTGCFDECMTLFVSGGISPGLNQNLYHKKDV